jgi:hypothetical protein
VTNNTKLKTFYRWIENRWLQTYIEFDGRNKLSAMTLSIANNLNNFSTTISQIHRAPNKVETSFRKLTQI